MSRAKHEKQPGTPELVVTMALPYANGDIHLGHLVEAVQADVFVRYQRMCGRRVLFVCADDTHGTPIELSALSRGISPRELVTEIGERHVRDYAAFDIAFDLFYSTDSPENRQYAELIFTRLREQGMVVEKEIEQYYCEHDGRFLPDRFIVGSCPRCGAADQYGDVCEVCGATYEPTELADPRCRLCRKSPTRRTSVHLFVDLKKSEDFLRRYINENGVLQADMLGFVNHWLDEGLRQWCISRDGPYFGFEIPGYPGKYFYVWLDAPIGYLSTTAKWCADHGCDVSDLWGERSHARIVHFIGKDIVYFHTLFWPVMLRYAGFKLPARFFVHGFLTIEGEKMSKSRGTFVLARTFLERMKHPQATQYLRFYFAAKLSGTSGDLDLNGDEFCTRVNATLINNIGNLHHRTFVFVQRYFQGQVPDAPWDESVAQAVAQAAGPIQNDYENADYKSALERIHALGSLGNKYYQDNAPWEKIRTDRRAAETVIVTCASLVRALMVFLKPVVPGIVQNFERQIGTTLCWDDWQFGMRGVIVGEAAKLAQPLESGEFAAVLGDRPQQQSLGAEIAIEDFQKVELRVATITNAERIAKSRKLLALTVEIAGTSRQIVAGIAEHYAPEQLVGRQVVVVANLRPAVLMGRKSEGMLLAADDNGRLVLVHPESPVRSGARVA